MTWQGSHITHGDHGRGLVLADLADAATHTQGRVLVKFDNGSRRWVDARNCRKDATAP